MNYRIVMVYFFVTNALSLAGATNSELATQAKQLLAQKEYLACKKISEQLLLANPKHPVGYFCLGFSCFELQEYEAALGAYKKATEYAPGASGLWYNLAYIARIMGENQLAQQAYLKTIELQPEHEDAHFGLAKTLLALGEFAQGWQEFEWRYGEVAKFKQPKRNPAEFRGKTIMLRTEWGFGDTIQFIRYAQLLKELGATVFLETFPALIPLLATCPFIDALYPFNSKLPPTDLQLPLLSLPYFFDTTHTTIPTPIPYLRARQEYQEQWKAYFENNKNFKIGICWHAKPIFLEDHPHTRRSVPLHYFAPLTQLPGVTVYSLQKVHGMQELEQSDLATVITSFGDKLDGDHGCFMDTAAIMQQLDLVISVDTALVHLAGALAVPTWVLLPYNAEWRWLEERNDSPWYPNSMKLFRQHHVGDWQTVMQEICNTLKELL